MSGMRGNVRRRRVGRKEAAKIMQERHAEREQRIIEQAAAIVAAERVRLEQEAERVVSHEPPENRDADGEV